MNDKDIIETIINNFILISKIPRPSHHEEKISNFLMQWAKKEGLKPIQDSVNNIMINIPPTKGMENKPLGILQAHMDMVVAVEDNKIFNPITDSITVIRNNKEKTLTADGTSLGADDGIGIAIIMAIIQSKIAHGPLRVIITVDEEDSMVGASNVNKSWLEDASYLINIDNEASDEVLVSTASAVTVTINKKITYIAPTGNRALRIELSNLLGGHSGTEIDKGRLNGIIGLANFLKRLDEDNINYELASFIGGNASNAIPTKANAIIVIDNNNKRKIENKLTIYCNELNKQYKNIENTIKYKTKEINSIPKVITNKEKNNMIKYITEVINGVYTWSHKIKGLVESSSNLGIINLYNDLSITSLVRSSSKKEEKELLNTIVSLASTYGFSANTTKSGEAWEYDPNSKLLSLAKEIYKKQNGQDIKVSALHAGIECGTFKKANPNLDMISVGPDLKEAHTINETLYINTMPRIWHLIEEIIEKYNK